MRAVALTIASFSLTLPASAQWTSDRPDGHAPIGVFGEPVLRNGQLTLSVRTRQVTFKGNRIGTSSVPDADIVSESGGNFLVAPTERSTQMQTLGVTWGRGNRVTLAATVPFMVRETKHLRRTGPAFTTVSHGLGDVSLALVVGLADGNRQQVYLNVGFTAPTGSITESGSIPGSDGPVQLPYPMQLGSGTWDPQPALTYVGQSHAWSWGVQGMGTPRFAENSRGWRLGSSGLATTWLARRLGDHFALSARVGGTTWGDVEGSDPAASVDPAVTPDARPDLRGGTRVDAGLGFNLYYSDPRAMRFSVEVTKPLYQNLHGPQLESHTQVAIGFQITPRG